MKAKPKIDELKKIIIKAISWERKHKSDLDNLSDEEMKWYMIQRIDNLHHIIFNISETIENMIEKQNDFLTTYKKHSTELNKKTDTLKASNCDNLKKLRRITKKLSDSPFDGTGKR